MSGFKIELGKCYQPSQKARFVAAQSKSIVFKFQAVDGKDAFINTFKSFFGLLIISFSVYEVPAEGGAKRYKEVGNVKAG